MTHLEQLIQRRVDATAVATVGRTVDVIAEGMAAELLKDAQFRADMLALIRRAMARTLAELNADAPAGGDTPT